MNCPFCNTPDYTDECTVCDFTGHCWQCHQPISDEDAEWLDYERFCSRRCAYQATVEREAESRLDEIRDLGGRL